MRYDKDVYRGLGGYGTLGLEIVLSILLGLFGGRWLDDRFGTGPWLGWVGFAFGVGAAVRAVQNAVRRMRIETAREEKEQGNPAPLWESDAERRARREEKRRQAELAGDEDPGEEHERP